MVRLLESFLGWLDKRVRVEVWCEYCGGEHKTMCCPGLREDYQERTATTRKPLGGEAA
jgi:hypothetical protein